MRRREFLTLSATSIGGLLVYSLDREVFRLSAQAHQSIRIPLRFLSQAEALIVAAAASRIFPSDEAGPGAQEAGVAIYIDRQLAGPWGRDRYRYTQGPFEENAPAEFGYQTAGVIWVLNSGDTKVVPKPRSVTPREERRWGQDLPPAMRVARTPWRR